MSDDERPWRTGGPFGHKFNDRWPATIVNNRHAGTYGDGWGLVLDPRLVSIRCGYAADGRSMDKPCESWSGKGCVPGCTPWCTSSALYGTNECAWKPEQMESLVKQQDNSNPWGHNEIVLDPSALIKRLPHSVMAVFYQTDSHGSYARAAWRRYLKDYGLEPRVFPLLKYHPQIGRPHFECIECGE